MAGGSAPTGPPTQSSILTAVFSFNLIVGVGALALPNAINTVGCLVGSLLIGAVGVLGYVSATFVMEAMGNSSILLSMREGDMSKSLLQSDGISSDSVVYPMAITPGPPPERVPIRHVELSAMVELVFPPWGQVLFYMIICVYLYGDLAIYGCAVPKTLETFSGWNYNYFLIIFSGCMIPFAFFDFQKTKYLQYLTLATRNFALMLMIILTIAFIARGDGDSDVEFVKPRGVSIAWGGIVYAFMMHHSIPSIVTPMKHKHNAAKTLLITFIFVAIVYWLLTLTAIFAFANIENKKCGNKPGEPCRIQSLYTENFSSFDLRWVSGFLTLFPVFTLSSSFPMITLTLRNTLITLFNRLGILVKSPLQLYVCAILAPVPPLILCFFVRDVGQLVGFTGSYAGMGIMFVVPTLLVHFSRRAVRAAGREPAEHSLYSPFQHIGWIYVILLWSLVTLVIITTNNIIKFTK